MKEYFITRTITSTEAEILVANTRTQEFGIKTITLPRTYKNNDQIISAANKSFPEDLVPLAVQKLTVKNVKYRMTEASFIEHSESMLDNNGGEQ